MRDDHRSLRALGQAVRAMREQAGLTGKELAARAKISNSWLSRIEDGQVDPTWKTVRMIAQGLEVTTEQLADLAESFEKET
jgi:transcriptional regulator with XRE-family HTH domain